LKQLRAVVGSIKSDGRDALGGGRQRGTGAYLAVEEESVLARFSSETEIGGTRKVQWSVERSQRNLHP